MTHPMSEELRRLGGWNKGGAKAGERRAALRRAADALDKAYTSEHEAHNRLDLIATERDELRRRLDNVLANTVPALDWTNALDRAERAEAQVDKIIEYDELRRQLDVATEWGVIGRELQKKAEAQAKRYKRSLSYALHAFRARISTHGNDSGLARGELACLIGLGEETQHVRMGFLGFDDELKVRQALREPEEKTDCPGPGFVKEIVNGVECWVKEMTDE